MVSLDINDKKTHFKICFQEKPGAFFTFCILTRLDVLGRREEEETRSQTLEAQKSPDCVRRKVTRHYQGTAMNTLVCRSGVARAAVTAPVRCTDTWHMYNCSVGLVLFYHAVNIGPRMFPSLMVETVPRY